MIAWYDPDKRTVRYRTTKTTDVDRARDAMSRFSITEPNIRARAKAPKRKPSRVYFIAGDVGAIKIGSASDVALRLPSLQCGSPIPLRILATTEGGIAAEREYHRRFAAHRQHGEWFERHPDILAEISRLSMGVR